VLYAYPPEIEESPVLPKSLEEKLKNVEGVKGTTFFSWNSETFFNYIDSNLPSNGKIILFWGGGQKYEIFA
jgi:hypothetical protein